MRPGLTLALTLALTAAAHAQSRNLADWLPPPPPGFVGTAFRGVALGQSRTEVEAALNSNGQRCAVDDDLASGSSIIADNPVTPCWIVTNVPVLSNADRQALERAIKTEQLFFTPYQSVWFVDGRATLIGVDFDYFNALGMSPYDIAVRLIENYEFPNGMQPLGNGYTGLTAKGEKVLVANMLEFRLVSVSYPGGGAVPTFD